MKKDPLNQEKTTVTDASKAKFTPPSFQLPIRVYYEDTDAGGVVYHSNYINFFERARTEWLRNLGFEQDQLISKHQVIFVVRALNCEYLKPALFNDELFVTVDIRELGKTSVVFKQQVLRTTKDEEKSKHGDHIILAEGNVTVVIVDSVTFRPKRLPSFLLEKIKENAQ